MTEIVGKSVLILGYGAEGQSVHRWLKKHYPRLKVGIADQKPLNRRLLSSFSQETPVQLQSGDSWSNWSNYDTIVKSPGIPPALPALIAAKAAGKHITSASNIFFSVCPGKIIAVTGTKGKSTTASLAAKILSAKYSDVRLVGNIGNPALDYLEGSDKNTLFVMEISSYQLEDIRYSPFVAIILDIVPEHLDRYRDFETYIAAKSQIVRFQSPADYVIFNPVHKIPAKIACQSLAQKICFSLNRHSEAPSDGAEESRRDPSLTLGMTTLLLGQGNLENCLAAITAAKILRVPSPAIRQAVENFKPLPHRLEKVGEFRGITFYDDSISTIPQSAIHGLNALGEKVATLIAGGFDRGLDYTDLGVFLANRKGLKNIILFPDTGAKIWQAILAAAAKQKHPLHLKKFNVSSMKQAVRIAFAETARGKICLLSPAAASYNLFKNFADRGNEFKRQVSPPGKQSFQLETQIPTSTPPLSALRSRLPVTLVPA